VTITCENCLTVFEELTEFDTHGTASTMEETYVEYLVERGEEANRHPMSDLCPICGERLC